MSDLIGQTAQNLYDLLLQTLPGFKRLRSIYWYRLFSHFVRSEPIEFINYGYAALPRTDPARWPDTILPLHPADELNRWNIQIYQRVVSAGQTSAQPLFGQDVLEISCGHGGGANFIARYFQPRSYTGLDLNDGARHFHTHMPGHQAHFALCQADAEKLPFTANSFDTVLNVEASHAYPHLTVFLAEVGRVLRPGGHFCFADLRPAAQLAGMHQTLLAAGLTLLYQEDISANVVAAMSFQHQRKKEAIARLFPAPLRTFTHMFVGSRGSPVYANLDSGKYRYLLYRFTKPVS